MKKRKDNKGRILKDGEYQRANGQYEYRYTDSFSGKQRSVYSWRLNETDGVPEGKKRDKSLRELEKEILKNDVLGIDAYSADRTTINDLFGMYLDMKPKLRETTRALYRSCYDRYIRDAIGSRSVGGIRYSFRQIIRAVQGYCHLRSGQWLALIVLNLDQTGVFAFDADIYLQTPLLII